MSYSGYQYEVQRTPTHLSFNGVEWGSLGNKLPIHHEEGRQVVCKLKTGRVYAGMGRPPNIVPASFMVFELCEDNDHANCIADFPVRSER